MVYMKHELLTQFEKLVEKYQKDIINFHYRLVQNRFEAEDLAQETFIKAYRKIASLQDEEKAKSWLYRIARNTTIDFYRKNKNRALALDDIMLEHYAHATAIDHRQEVSARELAIELSETVATLKAEDQMIIKLLYYEGFAYKEICTLLNINQNTLKSRLHRARKILLTAVKASKQLRDIAVNYS